MTYDKERQKRTEETQANEKPLDRLIKVTNDARTPGYMKLVIDLMLEMKEEIQEANRRNKEQTDEQDANSWDKFKEANLRTEKAMNRYNVYLEKKLIESEDKTKFYRYVKFRRDKPIIHKRKAELGPRPIRIKNLHWLLDLIRRMLAAYYRRRHVFALFIRLFSNDKPPTIRNFKKVLVASRGEVALRVFRTLREIEVESIGIYAHEDRFSQHRQMADKSFLVGRNLDPIGAYFDMEEIINIALENGVDAIHPGYGVLASRSDFAQRVIDAGMTFIGPTPTAIAWMADKLVARQCACGVNVKVIPGTGAPITTPQEAVSFFKKHNTPIILKPAYGQGGLGMRRVDSLARVAEAFELASQEAQVLFGDGSLLAEKLIEHPR
ncbi:hypothetical protein Y032_0058g2890 [Ancylostoma ceylanicum]|nr:hypothetical protein Y032_0058g2890 [Ancylostoma ceylanicum]